MAWNKINTWSLNKLKKVKFKDVIKAGPLAGFYVGSVLIDEPKLADIIQKSGNVTRYAMLGIATAGLIGSAATSLTKDKIEKLPTDQKAKAESLSKMISYFGPQATAAIQAKLQDLNSGKISSAEFAADLELATKKQHQEAAITSIALILIAGLIVSVLFGKKLKLTK